MPAPAAYMGPLPLPEGASYPTREQRDAIFARTGVSVSVRQRSGWAQPMMSLSGPATQLEEALRLAREELRLAELETATSKATSKAMPGGKGKEKGKQEGKGKQPGKGKQEGKGKGKCSKGEHHNAAAAAARAQQVAEQAYNMAYQAAWQSAASSVAMPVYVWQPKAAPAAAPAAASPSESSSPTPSPQQMGGEPRSSSHESLQEQPKKKAKEEPPSTENSDENEDSSEKPTQKEEAKDEEPTSPADLDDETSVMGLPTPEPEEAEACPADEARPMTTADYAPTTVTSPSSVKEDPLLPGPERLD